MARKDAFRLFPYSLMTILSVSAIHAQDLRPADLPSNASAAQATPPARRPVEMPPNPPKVSCAGNRLTVFAENSTLGSVLSAIHGCIGVAIEIPPAMADERTYFQLGPGPTRAMLEALLSSTTEFDYAIQSLSGDPDKILSVLLMPRVKDGGEEKVDKATSVATNHTMTAARRAWLDSRQVAAHSVAGKTDEEPLGANADSASVSGVSDSAVKEADAGAPKETHSESEGAPGPSTGSVAEVSDAPKPNTDPQPQLEAAPPSDANQEPAGDKGLQKKITDMQQLFEERKKMLADPGTPPPNKEGPP